MLRQILVIVGIGLTAGAQRQGVSQAPAHQSEHFPFRFVDEAPQDPDFKVFRDELLRAMRNRDVEALAESMSSALRVKEASWLKPPFSNTITDETERALELGGSFTTTRGAVPGRREFCAPYVYSAFPNKLPAALAGTADPWAIIGNHVAVRAQRHPEARVLTYLSWELVKADGWFADPQNHLQWAKVDLLDGRSGYVQDGQIRPTTDYHVCFANIDGHWMMTKFATDEYPGR